MHRVAIVVSTALVSAVALGACTTTAGVTAVTTRPDSAATADTAPPIDAARARPATQTDLDPTVTLADLPGIGTVRTGTTYGLTPSDVTVARVSAPALLPTGMLAAADGLAVTVQGTFDGRLELTLALPPQPDQTAIPGVLHIDDQGVAHVEPGIWDPTAGTITVTANTFSNRFGGWWNPLNWAETVANTVATTVTGVFDAAVHWVTGRTSPPACANNPPNWATKTTNELSSVHVCLQANAAPDGTPRVEVFLKSNRNTLQLITVPAGVDYIWVEDEPDWIRPILARAAGGQPTDILLPGGKSMSYGYRQPYVTDDYDTLSYLTRRMIVINQLMSLIGGVDTDVTLAIVSAAYSCASHFAGFDPVHGDIIPQGFDDTDGFYQATLKCALDLARSPDLAVSTLDLLMTNAGISAADRKAFLSRIPAALEHIGPTLAKIAEVLNVASVSVAAWDNIFDNAADGRLTIHLNGTRVAGATGSTTTAADAAGVFDVGCPTAHLADLGIAASSTLATGGGPGTLVHVGRTDHWAVAIYMYPNNPDLEASAVVNFDNNTVSYTGLPYFTSTAVLACLGMDKPTVALLGKWFLWDDPPKDCTVDDSATLAASPCSNQAGYWLDRLHESGRPEASTADNGHPVDGADTALVAYCQHDTLLGYAIATMLVTGTNGEYTYTIPRWYATLNDVCASTDGATFQICGTRTLPFDINTRPCDSNIAGRFGANGNQRPQYWACNPNQGGWAAVPG
jgi:hypothetical protein